MDDLELKPGMIGLALGADIPAHPDNNASVVIKTTYNDQQQITASALVIIIPLDSTQTAITSPKDADGNVNSINDGKIGFIANNDRFDNTDNEGNLNIQSYLALHDQGKAYLHIKLPITADVKTKQED